MNNETSLESSIPVLADSSIEEAPTELPALRAMSLEAMKELVARGGFPAFRAKQLFQWVYHHGAESLDEMTNLPKAMRQYLEQNSILGELILIEAQGAFNQTRKVLFRLHDGKFIESVVMRDEGKERTSLCLSSQVGCAVGCTFCLTGYGGFQRNCTPDEIVGQVLAVRKHLMLEGEQLHSLVFMGMGEPMLNLKNVVQSVRLITDTEGVAISPRRVTVSTSGVISGIKEFGEADTGANLAVSLNATTDEVRTSIMPLNKRWPIRDLVKALESFPMKQRQRITVEYVLMKGINDTQEDARRLAQLLRPLRCKINLIMFNKHELLDYKPVNDSILNTFIKTLVDQNYTVSVRWSKGREIEAACGQLAAHYFHRAA